MLDGDESGGRNYIPSKLPGGFDILKRGVGRGNKMNQKQTNTKIFIAATLTFSASFLVSLADMAAPSIMIYAYLFLLVNFAGYTFIYNRTRSHDRRLPVTVVSVIAAMIASGFTVSVAMAFGSKLAVTAPRNLIAYIVLIILITLTLLPEEAIDRIEEF